MSLSDTLHQNVIQSRHDRARRALFWARILGVLLAFAIAAILRTEPELRTGLAKGGTDMMIRLMDRETPAPEAPAAKAAPPRQLAQAAPDEKPIVNTRPRDRVKVNRFGGTSN